MFNLLVKSSVWAEGSDRLPSSRIFEFTEPSVTELFNSAGHADFELLRKLPALFVEETNDAPASQVVRIGTITRARVSGRDLVLEYAYDPTLPLLTNTDLQELLSELDIREWELSRTHWAVKEADLYLAVLRRNRPRRLKPRVFSLQDPERIESSLVSLMMPFSAEFEPVHQALRSAVGEAGLNCRRADDIWENPAIIQDVVSLIDRSRVVICDCTGRNSNVFYEAGIAHTLGREVILVTQSAADIPFDLRHLRYVEYLNNSEGRGDLKNRIARRLADLVGT